MSMLPQSNARLLSILGPRKQVSYGKAASDGPAKWTGNVDAYYTEKIITRVNNGALDRVKQTTFIIPGDLRPPVEIRVADTMTFTYAGQSMKRNVVAVNAKLGPPGTPKTVRLELEEFSA